MSKTKSRKNRYKVKEMTWAEQVMKDRGAPIPPAKVIIDKKSKIKTNRAYRKAVHRKDNEDV